MKEKIMVREQTILHGHVIERLRDLPDASVHCVVTSPPYWGLRTYGTDPQIWDNNNSTCIHRWVNQRVPRSNQAGELAYKGQHNAAATVDYHDRAVYNHYCRDCGAWRGELGSEPDPSLFVSHLVQVFDEVKRVLRDDGCVFVNLGDSYSANRGYQVPDSAYKDVGNNRPMKAVVPPKNLCLIPQRFAIAAQEAGWIVRSMFMWQKSNPLPSSVKDRMSDSHEWLIMLTKSPRYWYDADSCRVPHKYQAIDIAKHNYNAPSPTRDKHLDIEAVGKTRNQRPRSADYAAGGRNRRTGDAMVESLESLIQQQQQSLDQLKQIQRDGGLWLGEGDIPQALFLNPQPLPAIRLFDAPRYLYAHLRRKHGDGHQAQLGPHKLCMVFRDKGIPLPKDVEVVVEKDSIRLKCGQGRNYTLRPLSKNPNPDQLGLFDEADSVGVYADHFAAYPERLVATFLQLGCPSMCCPDCGKAWKRIIGYNVNRGGNRRSKSTSTNWDGWPRATTSRTTLYWQPGCDCDAGDPVPGTVLDPFLGTGTSLLAAQQLGRNGIGIELNPDYILMARSRLGGDN